MNPALEKVKWATLLQVDGCKISPAPGETLPPAGRTCPAVAGGPSCPTKSSGCHYVERDERKTQSGDKTVVAAEWLGSSFFGF